MAFMEGLASHALRNGRAYGRAALILLLVVPLFACDAEGNASRGAEYSLSVDCDREPGATAKQSVMQTDMVQILMAQVIGGGFNETWRLQVFPPRSDLTVSRPDGTPPTYTITPDALKSGDPQYIQLPHGALTIRQGAEDGATASAIPSPEVSAEAVDPLTITLGCQLPPAATTTIQPR